MKCKYCKKTIWPWQSYFSEPARLQETEHTVLIIPDYDQHSHDSCFFRNLSKVEVLPTSYQGYEY